MMSERMSGAKARALKAAIKVVRAASEEAHVAAAAVASDQMSNGHASVFAAVECAKDAVDSWQNRARHCALAAADEVLDNTLLKIMVEARGESREAAAGVGWNADKLLTEAQVRQAMEEATVKVLDRVRAETSRAMGEARRSVEDAVVIAFREVRAGAIETANRAAVEELLAHGM